MLALVFFYLLPPIGLACNFLFVIEKGRREYFEGTKDYEPIPAWIYLVGSLIALIVYYLLSLLTDIHLGLLTVIIAGIFYVGILLYMTLFARTKYQIKAWSNMAVLSVFSITYGLSSLIYGPRTWLIGLILALIAFIPTMLSGILAGRGHKVRVSIPVKSDMSHENVFFTPQVVASAIIIATTIAIVLIILL